MSGHTQDFEEVTMEKYFQCGVPDIRMVFLTDQCQQLDSDMISDSINVRNSVFPNTEKIWKLLENYGFCLYTEYTYQSHNEKYITLARTIH